MDKHARSQISRKHWPSTCTKQLVSDAGYIWVATQIYDIHNAQGGPVFQAAGPDYPKIFNQTGSLGAWPSLDESITRAFSRSADFSYTSAPMFHILHILSLLAFSLAICHHCQGSLGGVMWFGPWIFASENSSRWTALLWQTVCLYPDAWGICTIMSSLNVHDDMVLTDAPSVGSLRKDLSKQTVPRPTTTRPRHVDQNKNIATIQHVIFPPPARWGLLDFNRALLLLRLLRLLHLLTRCLLLAVQIPVGTAGPPPRAPDASGHCRTSTASCRSQWALPDLNRDFQVAVGTAGPQPWAPDPSGHCRTSTATSRSQWALPDLNRDFQIAVGTAGPQREECQKRCQIECQKICQIECQKVCQIKRQKVCQIECQIECQKICQIECQKVCQIKCQKVCQIECQIKCQIECQKICQIKCQNVCQIECQKVCQIKCQKVCMPDRMPDKMSDRMPEDMPDKAPECLQDRMPEDMPDCQIECQKICLIECQKICQ